jgi:hypothetical protein
MPGHFKWLRSAPAGFAAGIVAILAPVLATTSLDDVRCDHENPRVESYYSLGRDYEPVIESVSVISPEGSYSVPGRDKTCVERQELSLCFDAGRDYLTLEAFNESDTVAVAQWSRGVFIDENGARRKLDSDSYTSHRPTMQFPDRDAQILIGARTLEKAWPEGKQYYNVSGCKDAFILHESLVPARLTGSEAGDRAIVDRIAKERIPIAFEVPVRHGSAELQLRIEIRIVPQREAWERTWAEGQKEKVSELDEASK